MRKNTWRVTLALSCLLGAPFVGCSGKVDSGPENADASGGVGRGGSSGSSGTAGRGSSGGSGRGGTSAGSGGSAGFGGSSAGFAGTAAGGVSGGSAAGGASGSGVGANGGLACDPNLSPNPCFKCGIRECCFEFYQCGADPHCPIDGEVYCVQQCVISAVNDGGVVDDATVSRCASVCAHGATITRASNDMLACVLKGVRADGGTGKDCLVECFSGD